MSTKRLSGFSLIELSIVLVIIGVLASAAVVPLSATLRQTRYKQTQMQLEVIKQSLHGFLISAGRLPCPVDGAQPASQDNQDCNIAYGGLPGKRLGVLGQHSSSGALLDAWGNEYVYVVSMSDHSSVGTQNKPDWLTTGEPQVVGAREIGADLTLCRTETSSSCPDRDLISSDIVWVVFSHGESKGLAGAELENQDNDTVFALSAFSSHSEKPFNDQFAWASRSELIYWLLKAEWLP